MKKAFAFWFCIPVLVLLVGCQGTPDTMPEGMKPTPITEDGKEIAEAPGQQLFESNCASCHGQYGQNNPGGRGNINFTDASWQKTHTNDYIKATVRNGKSFMPAFETTFKPEELDELVKYIRTLPEVAGPS